MSIFILWNRIQELKLEHPMITEMITGIDNVKEQIKIASIRKRKLLPAQEDA